MTDTRPQLRWISIKTNPTAIVPVWAKKNVNTVYHIDRVAGEDIVTGWVLWARREDGTDVALGGFFRRKDAIEAANQDCGFIPANTTIVGLIK